MVQGQYVRLERADGQAKYINIEGTTHGIMPFEAQKTMQELMNDPSINSHETFQDGCVFSPSQLDNFHPLGHTEGGMNTAAAATAFIEIDLRSVKTIRTVVIVPREPISCNWISAVSNPMEMRFTYVILL